MDAFATVDDLSKFWRQITEDETDRATMLLEMASNRLRLIGEDSGVDLDAKKNASPAYASTLQWAVMQAVKRAISTPIDTPPVNQYQQTAGPYSENYTFTNPSGDLWFSKQELNALGLNGRQRLGSLSTTRCDIYGEGS